MGVGHPGVQGQRIGQHVVARRQGVATQHEPSLPLTDHGGGGAQIEGVRPGEGAQANRGAAPRGGVAVLVGKENPEQNG